MARSDILRSPPGATPARSAPAWAARSRISDAALSLGTWLVVVLSSELAIHGVGEPIRSAMGPLVILEAAVAVLAGRRFWRTRLPHWLLASFAATSLVLNGFLWAFTDVGTTLHDVHLASDTAAIGTQSAAVLALPAWTPFVGLVSAVVGLLAGNALPVDEARGACTSHSPVAEPPPRRRGRLIGRLGTLARALVGLVFLVIAISLYHADLRDVVLGVIVLPAAATLLLALRGWRASPLRLGAAGHLVTIAIVLVLSFVFRAATVLLFYGSAMLLAALSGNGGCEVTALSNWLRGRDDQVGCPLFAPFDALDRRSEARGPHA